MEDNMRRITFILLALAGLALVACGAGEAEMTAMCEALAAVEDMSPQIAALGEEVELDQIIRLETALDAAWGDLSQAVEATGDDNLQATFDPYDLQYNAVPAISQDDSVRVARERLELKNSIIQDAYATIQPVYC
jgi:hypothetical protein